MSFATDHPVRCARSEDLACQTSIPGSKWATIKAQEDGWFFSRQDDLAYCPAHVPGWVHKWRGRAAHGTA